MKKKRSKTVRNRDDGKRWRKNNGHFAQGNPGGPGNPHAIKIATYRNAIRDAVTEDDLRRVFGMLKKLALRGDIEAIRELLNRTLGKARIADSTLADIELPEMTSTRDTVAASNAILAAVRTGKLGTDDAAKIAALVELTRRSLETDQLAERLSALEKELGE